MSEAVKEVTLAEAPKRRSFRAAVRELEARLFARQTTLQAKASQLATLQAECLALEAEINALTDALLLVKPQPRKRAAKKDGK